MNKQKVGDGEIPPIPAIVLGESESTYPRLGASGIVALFCFLSIVAMPWWIYYRGDPSWQDFGSVLLWLLIGLPAAAWHGLGMGETFQKQMDEKKKGKRS